MILPVNILPRLAFPGFSWRGAKLMKMNTYPRDVGRQKTKNVLVPVTVTCTSDNENTMNITMKMNEKKLHTPIHVPRKPL